MRNRELSEDLFSTFRNIRSQDTVSDSPRAKKTPRDTFQDKYRSLSEKVVESFNSADLTFYFQAKSEEAGAKYIISNMKKDAAIFKGLKNKGLSNLQLCLMIEFVFSPEQTYLHSPLTPGVLASGWCNRLVSDSEKWALGEPILPPSRKQVREWSSVDNDTAKVGEW